MVLAKKLKHSRIGVCLFLLISFVGNRSGAQTSCLAPKPWSPEDQFTFVMHTFQKILWEEIYSRPEVLALSPLEIRERLRKKLAALDKPKNFIEDVDMDSIAVEKSNNSVRIWAEILGGENKKPRLFRFHFAAEKKDSYFIMTEMPPWFEYGLAFLGMRKDKEVDAAAGLLLMKGLMEEDPPNWRRQENTAELLLALHYEPAQRLVLSAFRCGNEPLRVAMAQPLAKSGIPKSQEAILATLKDPSPKMRAVAAASAFFLKDPALVIASLEPLLTDPEIQPRLEAAETLARLGDTRGGETLFSVAIFESEDNFFTSRARQLLYEHGKDEKFLRLFLSLLIKVLQDRGEDDAPRLAAMKTLGHFKNPLAEQPLWQTALGDPSYVLRINAVGALKNLIGRDALLTKSLQHVHNTGDPENERIAALHAIEHLEGTECAGDIAHVACEGSTEQIRHVAADVLTKITDPDTGKALILQDWEKSDPEIRLWRVEALGMLEKSNANYLANYLWNTNDFLIQLLGDPEEYLRIAARDALAKIDSENLRRSLADRLYYGSEYQRESAAVLLGNYWQQHALAHNLLLALRDRSTRVRTAAATSLENIMIQNAQAYARVDMESKELLLVIRKVLKEGNKLSLATTEAAVFILGQAKKERMEVLPILADFVTHSDPGISALARRLILKMGKAMIGPLEDAWYAADSGEKSFALRQLLHLLNTKTPEDIDQLLLEEEWPEWNAASADSL